MDKLKNLALGGLFISGLFKGELKASHQNMLEHMLAGKSDLATLVRGK